MSAELFRQIEDVFPSITGWCSLQRANELAAMIVALKPERSTVVGVWGGKETIPMAMAHRAIGCGKVCAIDPWSAPSSVDGQGQENANWWGEQAKHDQVYAAFICHLHHLGLMDWVVIHREPSDTAPVPSSTSVLIIDGNHGPQAIKDVERFSPSVPVGGIAYLDDLKWEGGNVERAAALLVERGFKRMYSRDTGAFYQRVK